MDIRKYGIVFAVAILTAIFTYAVADAIAKPVDYNECYRSDRAYGYDGPAVKEIRADGSACPAVSVDAGLRASCADRKGEIVGVRGDDNCIVSWECSTCNYERQLKEENRSAVIFYTMIILGLIAVVVGFLLPQGGMNEWVGAGFILGGILSLFVGTVEHWSHLARIARPFVIAAELAVVLYIVYKKIRNEKDDGHGKLEGFQQREQKPSTQNKTRRAKK